MSMINKINQKLYMLINIKKILILTSYLIES
jgi:hypothetical protein